MTRVITTLINTIQCTVVIVIWQVLAKWSTGRSRYGPGDVLSGVENRRVVGKQEWCRINFQTTIHVLLKSFGQTTEMTRTSLWRSGTGRLRKSARDRRSGFLGRCMTELSLNCKCRLDFLHYVASAIYVVLNPIFRFRYLLVKSYWTTGECVRSILSLRYTTTYWRHRSWIHCEMFQHG